MLVGFDGRLAMRELYYPRVGQVNHIVGWRNQIGIWADGAFGWVGDDGWEIHPAYRPGSMVTDSRAVHPGLGIALTVRDGVHPRETVLVRRVRVENLEGREREVRLFTPLDLDLDETDVGDTAFWDPHLQVICHYKRNRWVLIGAEGPRGGIDQFATGRKRFQGAEGTWKDAEDGRLEGHPISQGAVDSTIGLTASVGPRGTADFYIWMAIGTGYHEVKAIHEMVQATGAWGMLAQTDGYWRTWSEPGLEVLNHLPSDLQEAYRRSLLIVRTQVDDDGAILAANDTDILHFNRDHYSYNWPRDGAFIAAALDRAGREGVTRRFYRFCRRTLSAEGFFWHKYNPDGSIGSSWHPWVGAKGEQLPIQEDETALILWALGQHMALHRDPEFLRELYPGLVTPAADFLVRYRDERTGLPQESYDLWEERRGVFTFTTGAVIAGLEAAARMAAAMGDTPRAEAWQGAAAEVRTALDRHLWSEEHGRFLRGLYVRRDGSQVVDATLESSTLGLFLLGVLPPTDPRLAATVRAIEDGLSVRTGIGGIARYYDDYYFRVGDDPAVIPGNPWIISTLWTARYRMAVARTPDELEPALERVRWALRYALSTGVLPEQVHPLTGEALSVAPLTWSHATLVDALLDLAGKLAQFERTEEGSGGLSLSPFLYPMRPGLPSPGRPATPATPGPPPASGTG